MKAGARRGVTLVEVMLACSILAISTLALFEGIMVASRIVRENSDFLTAEAIVWDAVWKEFNKDFSKIAVDKSISSIRVTELEQDGDDAEGGLHRYDTPPLLLLHVGGDSTRKYIWGDLIWGPANDRKHLSSWNLTDIIKNHANISANKQIKTDIPVKTYNHDIFVYRGRLERKASW